MLCSQAKKLPVHGVYNAQVCAGKQVLQQDTSLYMMFK